MIISFKSEETRVIFEGGVSKKYPPDIQRVAHRKLLLLASVIKVESLRIPPGNRLEKLQGDREGQWSIRVNDQWRICFRWQDADQVSQTEAGALDVEMVDYH